MQQLVTAVLAAWREAERVALHGGTDERRRRAAAAAERLRAVYRDLTGEGDAADADALGPAIEGFRVPPEEATT